MVDKSDTLYTPNREFLKFSVVGAMHKAPLMPYTTLLKILKEDLEIGGDGGSDFTPSNVKVSGDVSLTFSLNSEGVDQDVKASLPDTGVDEGIHGSNTMIPVINVDSKGRLLKVNSTVIGKVDEAKNADWASSAGYAGSAESATSAYYADQAGSLKTPHNITLTGDVESVGFSIDGSGGDKSVILVLNQTGVNDGVYDTAKNDLSFKVGADGRLQGVSVTPKTPTLTATSKVNTVLKDSCSIIGDGRLSLVYNSASNNFVLHRESTGDDATFDISITGRAWNMNSGAYCTTGRWLDTTGDIQVVSGMNRTQLDVVDFLIMDNYNKACTKVTIFPLGDSDWDVFMERVE